MDFNSLGNGSPFYILKKTAKKPILMVGTVKSKTTPQAKMQNGTNAFNGNGYHQVINITATVDGNDKVFIDVPINVEVAQSGDEIFTGSQPAMAAVVENLIAQSRSALEQKEYHETMIVEGDKILEVLKPQYAEGKKQAQTISNLEKKQEETDRKLDDIHTMLEKLLAQSERKSTKI